ncbi:alpha-mannosidase [Friedmanniella endophytica]|uniref:Alpha-mannosidase n=1 Tax=Microlunatus kandeliicorticis TaxID=1759536 RepID=A0A7W3P7R6_9ACTN|nr:glycoside hydrolase family 38 C-terminal domain-containing protein [Microlunatus kandeliicorticis]MBA8796318.1 alpha-mannosidase [Microlunatus kandeliicorticis]
MHDHSSEIASRVRRVLKERITPAIHTPLADLALEAWHVTDGTDTTGQGEPVPPSAALPGSAQRAEYTPFSIGESWGPAWGTTWFHVTGTAPSADELGDVAGGRLEIVLELGWSQRSPGFQCEGLVYRADGSVIKALNPMNTWIPVEPGTAIDLYVEAAANPIIGNPAPYLGTELGDKRTAAPKPLYTVTRADVNLFAAELWELAMDIDVLDQLATALPESDPRRADIRLALERALDVVSLHDVVGSAAAAREVLAPVLARPATASAHTITATGHAHIDSAWLWPTRETVRKVARTAANQLNLLAEFPEHVFAMSSAQQYAWIKEHRPEVFEGVRKAVADGRYVPVGGMWVESDTNMVGSEAMARQLTYGQRFFAEEFGSICEEVWLPDSFGYSAGLPQIVKLAGAKYFLTQKISWNLVNKFPHHTFMWEGIDGTRVLTHFPPVDTYNSDLSGRELGYAVGNFRDKGASSHSLAPFGFGDGGGGPTREMLARAKRTADLEGSPKVVLRSPREFFADVEAEYTNAPVWKGELYLEIHRGTYTSQAKTKQGNRRSEHLLREAEQWSAAASVLAGHPYPHEDLDRIWRNVLLNQFHDILPGSSIAWVHREAREQYAAIAVELGGLIDAAQQALVGHFAGAGADGGSAGSTVFNGSPFPRHGLAGLSAAPVPARTEGVEVREGGAGTVIENARITVTVDDRGLITSLVDRATGREVVPAGQTGNLLQLHQDFPNNWDAWDIDQFYKNTVTDLTDVDSVSTAVVDGAAVVTVKRSFGDPKQPSTVEQTLTVAPDAPGVDVVTTVDWHEQDRLLKLAFPVELHTDRAAFETQYGHHYRPTHENTSWDNARFEVCAHRWIHVGETGFGVGLANNSTYGHDVSRHQGPEGTSYTVLRQSIVRGPRFPDPRTDQDVHTVAARLVVSPDVSGAIEAGYDLNLPERSQPGAAEVPALVSVTEPGGAGALVVEAVKLADDRSGDLVVRLYESLGGRARGRVEFGAVTGTVTEVDLLERPLAQSSDRPGGLVEAGSGYAEVALRPFQIVTLRVAR